MESQSIFDKKNVLVIGGAGFVGSHLCDRLVKECKVICVDNFVTGDENNIDHLLSEPNFKFINHDISEPLNLEALPELEQFKVQFQGIQEIYNLACPTSPRNFNNHLLHNLFANSRGIINSLELAAKYHAKFLHYSSSVVYGARLEGQSKIKEDFLGVVDFLSPRASYDEGKRFAETAVVTYGQVHKFETKIMRLFRTYGPRMKLNDDQMIPDFVSDALDGKDLLIYGDENFSSSFCYISDVIDASLKLMEKEGDDVINIGSDTLVNLTELANKIIKMVGSNSKVLHQPEILFMSQLPIPDISKALNDLGWLPIVTLEKGLEKAIYELRASKGLIRIS
ncbi:NAD-dependent epimerase/dehydratase family protein [Candidatus Falkowbacteria bacterium]|nr:NAD-dependent epimerase/dehydratase family protein [Candidatus Falkowbacteria bacterium]